MTLSEEVIAAAVAAGIDAYRTELEDERAHPEDALRVALRVAIARACES